MSILLIEDDLPLADGIARALQREGYRVDLAGTVSEACRFLDSGGYGLVVLDLGLPDLDGSAVVKYMSDRKLDTPVLVLSARDGLEERVNLLDLGADDYLVKPAALDELLARVRALLRRRSGNSGRVAFGCLQLDLGGKRAYLNDKVLDLNGREWMLLVFLCNNTNRILTREEIAVTLYESDTGFSVNAIEQIMSRFRKRLAHSGLNLRTVRGLGYFFQIGGGAGGD